MENIHKASEQPMPMLVNPVTGTTIGVAYNQQNIGTTIRPASTSLLTIDSEDRYTSYTQKRNSAPGQYNWSPYDFGITKPESIMNGFFTRLGVTEVVFPTGALPNINDTTNQIGITWDNGTSILSTIISLPNGFYTPSALCSTLQAIVRNADTVLAAFTMSYGLTSPPSTPSPEIIYDTNVTAPVIIEIGFFPMPYNSVAYPYPSTTRQLFDLLGFSAINVVNSFSGNSGVTYCQGTRYVDIVSPQLSYNQPLKDTSSQPTVRDSLCRIYLIPDTYLDTVLPNAPGYAPPGTLPQIIYRNFTNPKQIAWSPNQPIGQLTFQVYDDNGALLKPYVTGGGNAQNNMEWSMSILVTEN